eukprot:Nk52_evm15s2657 gene=Nk52_evmTU15s2657
MEVVDGSSSVSNSGDTVEEVIETSEHPGVRENENGEVNDSGPEALLDQLSSGIEELKSERDLQEKLWYGLMKEHSLESSDVVPFIEKCITVYLNREASAKELADLSSQNGELVHVVESLQKHLAEKQSSEEKRKEELQKTKDEVREKEIQIENVKEVNDSVNVKCAALEKRCYDLEFQVETASKERAGLIAKSETVNSANEVNIEKIKGLEDIKGELEDKLKKSGELVGELNRKLVERDSMLTSAQQSLEEKTKDALKNEQNFDDQRNKFKTIYCKLESERDELQAKLGKYKKFGDVDELTSQMESFSVVKEQFESTLLSFEDAVREANGLRSDLGARDGEILSLKDDLSAVKLNSNVLMDSYSKLKEMHKETEEELNNVKMGVGIMEEQHKELTASMKKRYEDELASLQQLLKDSLSTRHHIESTLKSELEGRINEISRLKDVVDSLEKDKLNSKTNFMEESRADAELESQLLKEAVVPLQQEIENLKAELEMLHMKLEQQQNVENSLRVIEGNSRSASPSSMTSKISFVETEAALPAVEGDEAASEAGSEKLFDEIEERLMESKLLKTQIAKLTLDYEGASREIEVLKGQRDQECNRTNENAEEMAKKEDEMRETIARLEKSNMALKELVDNKELSILHLRNLHEQSNEEISARIEASYSVHEKLTRLYEELESAFDDTQRNHNEVLEGFKKELSRVKSSVRAKEDIISEKDSEISALKKSGENLKADLDEVVKKHGKVEKSLEFANKQKRELMGKVDSEAAKRAQLEDVNRDLVEKTKQLAFSENEVTSMRSRYEQQIGELKADVAKERSDSAALKWELNSVQMEKEHFDSARESLSEEFMAKQEQMKSEIVFLKEKSDKERRVWRTSQISLENALKCAKDQLSELKTSSNLAEKERLAAETKFREISAKSRVMRHKSKEIILALQAELDEQKDSKKVLEKEITILREQLRDGISVQADFVKQSQDLQRELARLKESEQKIRWETDAEAAECRKCSSNFSVTRRRHHCRQCGRIFCSDCSSVISDLPGASKAVRLCDDCNHDIRNSVLRFTSRSPLNSSTASLG